MANSTSAVAVGRLLAQLGIPAQKPLHLAQERDEALVQQWLRGSAGSPVYPKFKQMALKQRTEV
ncbi:MAG: winged helix-turn-helix domain-containing protein [Methylocella sp.]